MRGCDFIRLSQEKEYFHSWLFRNRLYVGKGGGPYLIKPFSDTHEFCNHCHHCISSDDL